MLQGLSIDKININQTAQFSKTISESDIYMFAGITGDYNPAHINEFYAKNTIFKERIAHGILSAGLISSVIGTQLPGPGTIYASQTLKFIAPVKIGDTVTAKVKVIDISTEKNRIKLETCCYNQNEKLVLQGEAVVLPPKINN